MKMETLITVALIGAAGLLLRASVNAFYWRRMKKASAMRQTFMAAIQSSDMEQEKKAKTWLLQNTTEIKRMVNKSGIRCPRIPKAGGAKASDKTEVPAFDPLDNLTNGGHLESDNILKRILPMASGHYKNEMLKNFNPIFWIEWIVFLPTAIVVASEMQSPARAKAILQFLQIVYWALILWAMSSGRLPWNAILSGNAM